MFTIQMLKNLNSGYIKRYIFYSVEEFIFLKQVKDKSFSCLLILDRKISKYKT